MASSDSEHNEVSKTEVPEAEAEHAGETKQEGAMVDQEGAMVDGETKQEAAMVEHSESLVATVSFDSIAEEDRANAVAVWQRFCKLAAAQPQARKKKLDAAVETA